MTPRLTIPAALGAAAALAVLTGCAEDPTGPTDPAELRLVSYDSCEQAVGQLRTAAQTYLTAAGLGGWAEPAIPDLAGAERATDGDSAGAAEAAPALSAEVPGQADPGAAAAPSHSGTNVHEAGVDEPDIIKTDGTRILTLTQGTLRVVDAASRELTGTLDLFPEAGADDALRWTVTDLLLHGDRALVLVGETYPGLHLPAPGEPGADPAPPTDATEAPIVGPRMMLVDLTGAPAVVSEYTMDGGLVDARAVGGTVRVVVRSEPRLEFPPADTAISPTDQLSQVQAAIEVAGVSQWLPRYRSTAGGQTASGSVDCTAVSHPTSYSGTSMLTVLTFDLAAPALGDGLPLTVVADGQTVYGTGTSLYVAADQRWQAGPAGRPMDAPLAPDGEAYTELHKFDTSQPGQPRYAGSGGVAGWLLNQYALSEWDGHLRVATTTGDAWWGGEADEPSESTVYVLAEQDGELVEVGSVGGIGETEQIYAVRFIGPIGYVVTFRQTDPLYTIDLSDPAAPALRGELHINGYSAYLHPISEDRLIGVGQEADDQGRVQGTQVSLFDVSELSDPQRVAQHHVEHGYSEAEFDPHAFLWWPQANLLVIPLVDYEGTSGVLVLEVDGDQLAERGQLAHPDAVEWDYSTQIRRSLVIEDTLWTYSERGLAAHDLSTLDELAWLPF